MVKRAFDLVMVIIATIVLIVPIIFVAILIKITSNGPILYWSNRVGRYNKIFMMPKFRTMVNEAPLVATHLLDNPDQYLTKNGKFLRKSSLDELPQLFCIFLGDMSFVGPRPALFNQDDLIALRTKKGVHTLIPGLTGWAQINGRDEISLEVKVDLEREYLNRKSFWFDLKIILLTIFSVLFSKGIKH